MPNPIECLTILELREEGWNQQDIADMTHWSVRTVQRVLNGK